MLTVKCYDMNCYAKSRLPSLEIKNCDLNKTASVQSLHFTNNVVWIRMLDGQEGRCTANRCTESVAPSKDLRYLLAWLRQERCNRSHNSATSTFLRCQVPLTLCLDMLLKWMSWLMPIKFCLYSVQPLDNWRRPPGRLPGSEMFAMTCPHLAWSCQKPIQYVHTSLYVHSAMLH